MRSEKGIGAITLVIVVVIVVAIAVGVYMFTLGSPSPEVVQPTPSAEESTPPTTPESVENTQDEVTFDITGKNFEFSEDALTVKQGQTVTVNFTSEGGVHDFVIDEFDVATDQVQSGETSSVTFVADQAGEFEFYCSVGDHRQMGMVGTLTVTE